MIKIFRDRVKRIGLTKTMFLSIDRLLIAIRRCNKLSIRICGCCGQLTLFAQLGHTIDGVRCIRCGANKRYELLAQSLLSTSIISLPDTFVVEMDPNSPLSQLLNGIGCRYLKTFYSETGKRGEMIDDAQIEDACAMTLADASVDILISSDVLEHIPDLHGAIKEANRILKQGGQYFFTVPLSDVTAPRAIVNNGVLINLKPPIYHLDPLNPTGCLVYWDFADDMVDIFKEYGFVTSVMAEDKKTGYKAWRAIKSKCFEDKSSE